MRGIIVRDVDSSAVESLGYDEAQRELYVRYRGGEAYTYLAVPPEEWLALDEADSIGEFINREIKPKYEFRKGAPI